MSSYTRALVLSAVAALLVSPLAQAQGKAKGGGGGMTLGDLKCGVDEIAKYNGSEWVCSADLSALSQAVEGIGDLGCSATQQDNSVLITCGDGTAGVIAGAGTVVIYPEGLIGQVPPIDYNTGPIVAIDGSGVVLGEVSSLEMGGEIVRITLFIEQSNFEFSGKLINRHETQEVLLSFVETQLFFLSDDCSGLAFINPYANDQAAEWEGRFFVGEPSAANTILFKSYLFSGSGGGVWNPDWQVGYIEPSECVPGDLVSFASPVIEYVPPPEISNAVYPVRVEQLP